ncbi:MAG: Mpo1-like protein [Bdellovibrio sp.]
MKHHKTFNSFSEFWPFYLSQHQNKINRLLHALGTCNGVLLLIFVSNPIWAITFALIVGYGFAWIGHFVFEKNKPATFRHPFYSFIGDLKMVFYFLTFKK